MYRNGGYSIRLLRESRKIKVRNGLDFLKNPYTYMLATQTRILAVIENNALVPPDNLNYAHFKELFPYYCKWYYDTVIKHAFEMYPTEYGRLENLPVPKPRTFFHRFLRP